jgi:hypothetical protein
MNPVSLRDCPHPLLPAFNPHTAVLRSLHWRLLPLLPQHPARLVRTESLGKGRKRTSPQLSPHNHRHPTTEHRKLPTGDPRLNELPRIMQFVERPQLKSSTNLIAEACLEAGPVQYLLPESRALLAAQHPTFTPSHLPLAVISMIHTPKDDAPRQQHTLQSTRSTPDSFSLARRSIVPPTDLKQTSTKSADPRFSAVVQETVAKN